MEIKGLTDTYVETPCVCPDCGQIHTKLVERSYLNSQYIWSIDGKVARLCNDCRARYTEKEA